MILNEFQSFKLWAKISGYYCQGSESLCILYRQLFIVPLSHSFFFRNYLTTKEQIHVPFYKFLESLLLGLTCQWKIFHHFLTVPHTQSHLAIRHNL